ncbi:synergin gamma-like isoform X2 [Leptopilina heterotoma]|uniref:synergin gamma-like isoform X2 n=1 Tax=Leptopilina heterotoma TaxID=63436 RepID=UPI001CA8A5F4|nr:synergin gamma-like isoform X2 [Leptopilina heterotoma]
MHKVQNQSEKKMSQLPGWLWPNSNILPPIYKKIWESVREDKSRPGVILSEVLVDTNKIFPLLLTSQLSTEVLGYIWGIANKKYAGQLTEQELYTVLALVALAQASYPFNSIDVLHHIRVPPIPNLNISLFDSNNQSKQESKVLPTSESSVQNSSNSTNSNTNVNSSSMSHSNSFSLSRSANRTNSAITSTTDNLFHDSRIEAKNSSSSNNCGFGVNFSESLQTTRKYHSSDSSDDFSEFQSAPLPTIPQIPMWDSRQGSAIGSRLANHNLGVKKSMEKLKKNPTTKMQKFVKELDSCQSTNHERNFLASNDLQLIDSGNTTFYRDANFDGLTDLFPKCSLKSQSKTVILKDTIIRNEPTKSVEISSNNISEQEKISSNYVEKTPNTNKFLPAESAKDLMNLQQTEDKYSALRVLDEVPVGIFNKTDAESVDTFAADDFGDFVCAEQPTSVPSSIVEPFSTETNVDLFSEFDFKGDDFLISGNKTETSLVQEISDAFDALGFEEFREQPPIEEKAVPKEDCLSVNSIELGNNATGVLTRSGSVPSLDLKSFFTPNHDDESAIENMQQMIYWEWKHYMESCVLLLQVAANIFSNISSEAVLREVLASAQGYNFLCNLAEVAAVCRRVNFSHKEMDINIMGFDDLLMDIDRIWAEMEPFYTNIPIVTELPVWPLHQNDNVTCALCLTVITSGKVSHNESNYHVTCANLWLNCVNSNLPVLRNPTIQSHFAITNSINQI